MQEFIQQLRHRKKIATYAILVLVFAFSVGFFYLTASETWAYGIEKLGEERYAARMKDSYLYAAALSLMAVPLIWSLQPFFNRYEEELKKLSQSEMERLKVQNQTAPFFNKYLPGYIAKDKSIIFFKFLRTTEIRYADITKMHLSIARASFLLHVTTKTSFFIGIMGENFDNLDKMMKYAKEVNPEIEILGFKGKR